MLYESYAYQKRTIALHDLRSVTPGSESLCNHSFTTVLVLPPPSLIFFLLYTCMCANVCVYVSFLLFCYFRSSFSFRDIFSSRAVARTVCLPQVRGDVTVPLVTSCDFHSKSHARNRAQQPRNKICNRKSGCIASRLISLVRMEESRLAAYVSSRRASAHPHLERVRRPRERDPRGPRLPPVYNLYTKIKAF
jgi:hypothetical protein